MREAVRVGTANHRHVIHASSRLGKRSETSIPDSPHFVNLRLEPSKVPGFRPAGSGISVRFGMGWRCHLFNAGLGSHVSTWLGPPYIKRKIQDFALAAK